MTTQHPSKKTSSSNSTSIVRNSMINILLRVIRFATMSKKYTFSLKAIRNYPIGVAIGRIGVTIYGIGVAIYRIGVPNGKIGVPNGGIGVPIYGCGVPNGEIGVPIHGIGVPNGGIGVPICPMLIIFYLTVNLFHSPTMLSYTHTASYFPTLFIGALVQPTIRAPCSAKKMKQINYL